MSNDYPLVDGLVLLEVSSEFKFKQGQRWIGDDELKQVITKLNDVLSYYEEEADRASTKEEFILAAREWMKQQPYNHNYDVTGVHMPMELSDDGNLWLVTADTVWRVIPPRKTAEIGGFNCCLDVSYYNVLDI